MKYKTWEEVIEVYLVSESELTSLGLGEFHFRELKEVQLKQIGSWHLALKGATCRDCAFAPIDP